MLEYSSSVFMKMILFFSLLFIANFKVDYAQNDECDGAAIRTHEAYLYGRFETKMKSTQGSGIVSSFFLYNWDIGCNWPEENNEIDIEMTGNMDASVQFTTHHPYQTSVTEIVPTSFNPHEVMTAYAIEWEPNVVRWFIDGELVLEQTHNFIPQLQYPMRIFMNLWAVSLPTWTGEWDPSFLPGMSKYDYVKYYEYTPGFGDYGTNNNYSLVWEDNFDNLDDERWDVDEGGNVGPLCTFRAQNINVINGELILSITEFSNDQVTRPVKFGVDVSALDLQSNDVVYINGGFNSWCGNCMPLSDDDGDGIWTLDYDLSLGEHQYQYAINGWSGQIFQPELGSSCDYNPCDEWTNFGVLVEESEDIIYAPIYCWGSCQTCSNWSNDEACIADFDSDSFIGISDVLYLLSQFGCMGICDADIVTDFNVNVNDVLQILQVFGVFCI